MVRTFSPEIIIAAKHLVFHGEARSKPQSVYFCGNLKPVTLV